MKTIKKSFFRSFDKIIVLLLSGFGLFSACNLITPEPEYGVLMYGMPSANFVLQGTVTNNATSQPIKNIRVIRPFGYNNSHGDTIYTDANGKYLYEFGGSTESKFQLKFEDIDGEDNGGLFQTKVIEGEFTQADRVEEGKGWYTGKYVKTQDVKLEQAYPTPEYGVRRASFQP